MQNKKNPITPALDQLVRSVLVCVALTAAAAPAAATILRIDAVNESGWSRRAPGGAGLRKQAADAEQKVTISIGSRRLPLALTSNLDLLEGVSPEERADVLGTSVELWRGSIQGVPGSWVRLMRTARGLRGVIYDGAELFVVPLGEVRRQLARPTSLPDDRTVAFALQDVESTQGSNSCPVHAPILGGSSASDYANLGRELQGLVNVEKPGARGSST